MYTRTIWHERRLRQPGRRSAHAGIHAARLELATFVAARHLRLSDKYVQKRLVVRSP